MDPANLCMPIQQVDPVHLCMAIQQASEAPPSSKLVLAAIVIVDPVPVGQSELSAMTTVPKPTVRSSTKHLESEGLIEVQHDTNDARKKRYSLSSAVP